MLKGMLSLCHGWPCYVAELLVQPCPQLEVVEEELLALLSFCYLSDQAPRKVTLRMRARGEVGKKALSPPRDVHGETEVTG